MAAAMAVISRFRHGGLGYWPVDRVTPDAFDKRIKEEVMARQRESRGAGDVLETKVKRTKGMPKGGLFILSFLMVGIGPMSGAIEKGRQDAQKAVRKPGNAGNRGKVTKRIAGTASKTNQSRGVRKVINRNKGSKPRKRK